MPSIVINGVNYSGSSAKGTIVKIPAAGWVQSGSTYKNTIPVQGISANSNLNASLYDSENEELCRIFSELITGAEAGDNQIILTASELITVDFKILVYGEINFDVEEESLTAENVLYDNSVSGLDALNLQSAIDKIMESGTMTTEQNNMLTEIYNKVLEGSGESETAELARGYIVNSDLGSAIGLTSSTSILDAAIAIDKIPNKGVLNWNPSSSTSQTVVAGYYTGGTLNSSDAYNAGIIAGKKNVTHTLSKQVQFNNGSSGFNDVTATVPIPASSKGLLIVSCISNNTNYNQTASFSNVNGVSLYLIKDSGKLSSNAGQLREYIYSFENTNTSETTVTFVQTDSTSENGTYKLFNASILTIS